MRESGSGWVTDTTAGGNHKSHFAFNVAASGASPTVGVATFSWTGPLDGNTYSATCTSWVGGGAQFSGTSATITCLGTVSAVNPKTGLVVAGVGGSGYAIVLKATDSKTDTFSALVKTPGGTAYHNLSGAGGTQLAIGGGNISYQAK